jgi:hypothetical protein
MAFPSYSTGTVSISANATAVVGVGSNWSGQNAMPGDLLVVAGQTVIVQDVTDALHLVIDAWPFTAVTAGAAYKLYKVSPLRFAGGQAMAAVDTLVSALNTSGFYVFVGPTETVPDPSLGDNNQYALQATTGKLWQKTGGTWNFIGIQKGFSLPAPWSSATAYLPFDVASLGGTSYVCILANTNQAPPNATYWTVLAGVGTAATVAVGTVTTGAGGSAAAVTNAGTSGAAVLNFTIPQGSGYGGTSATSLVIANTVTRVFTTQLGLGYNGSRVRAASAANPVNYMEGVCTYSGTTLTMTVDAIGGSGTFADWVLSIAGQPGVAGGGALLAANNLSDVANAATSLGNLGGVSYAAAQSLTGAQQTQAQSNIGVAFSSSEKAYWADKAALLDPAAYVYWAGAHWSVTVPAGETWYIANAWHVAISGSSPWFHRDLATSEVMPVPAGTVLAADGSGGAFMYVCRPALVTGDSAYNNPKDLYYSRLNTLRSYVVNKLSATVTVGAPISTISKVSFPTDFDDGMGLQVSVFDLAWYIFANSIGDGGVNTTSEISDVHQFRTTKTLLTPFSRALFPSMWAQAANASGNATDVAWQGSGNLSYYKLPSTWRTASPVRAYRAAVLSDHPLVYYPFDETTSTTVTDNGSTGLNATYAGATVRGAVPALGDGSSATYFPDSTSIITIPYNAVFDLAARDFTMECWVNFTTLPTLGAGFTPWIINNWVTVTTGAAVTTKASFLLAVSNGKLAFLVGGTDATTTTVSSSVTLATDTYYHVIFGRASGNLFIRVVGKEGTPTREAVLRSRHRVC